MKNPHGCAAIESFQQVETPAKGEAEWDALHAALREFLPPCADRKWFTADRLSDEQRELCASICASCPVAGLCGSYADAANVRAGFWAGHSYTPKGKQ